MRSINENFKNNLQNSELLKIVRADDTLNMELRGNYVTVYYRGCAALTLSEEFVFSPCNEEYFNKTNTKKTSVSTLQEYFLYAKHAIDKFIFEYKENAETETQQLIVRENNYSTISNNTDYFIIDIEYKNNQNKEFDLITLRWKADKNIRRKPKMSDFSLVIFELKYGKDAIGNSGKAKDKKSASISEHMNDFNNFIANTTEVDLFKKDMLNLFKQKCELGLIRFGENKNEYKQQLSGNNNFSKLFDDSNLLSKEILENINIDFGYIFANYIKRSSILKEELMKFNDDFIFITSSFMGYGLFSSEEKRRIDLEEIVKKQKSL